jgi:ectoine hydroxylase-related dioxygenase (phytanoyl-CoA dioxygenase family)
MPLTDLAGKASRLQVLPRSHRLAGYERMQTDATDGREHDADLLPADFERSKLRQHNLSWVTAPADMKAGDVILFNWKLIHSATEHKDAKQPRLSVDTRIALHALDR